MTWQPATYPAVHDFLTNPVYAGAFVFGRTRTEKRIDPTGTLVQRRTLLPRDQWAVLIPDHHPGLIDWATYEANTARLRSNWRVPRGFGGGPPREGTALLQCGKCSRLMQTGYSGTKGNCPRYVCARAKQLYGGEQGCQSIGGRRLEERVLDEVFAVLQPAALAATAQALTDAERAHAATLHAFELSVERTRYEAARARRQYDAVEPENRLVARTLERALENKLAAQRHAERDLLAAKARRLSNSPTTNSPGSTAPALTSGRCSTRHRPRSENASNCCGRSCPRSSSPSTPRTGPRRCGSSGKAGPTPS